MKELIEVVATIIGLAGIAYRFWKLESKIYDAIKDLRKDFAVHHALYEVRREWVDYMLHALDKKIDHKFERLREEAKLKREV
ncbi:MAG: hypothetical protein ACR2LR_04730 [Hassallia sp.]